MFKIECPECSNEYELDESYIGRKVECTCGQKFYVDQPERATQIRTLKPNTLDASKYDRKKSQPWTWVAIIMALCLLAGVGIILMKQGENTSTDTDETAIVVDASENENNKIIAPFGKPEQEVYGKDIHTDKGLWKIKRNGDHYQEDYQIPKKVSARHGTFFQQYTDPATSVTGDDIQWLKDYTYHYWRSITREALSVKDNPLNERARHYNYPTYPHCGKELLDHFDQIDPRKEYIDWVITYSEMLAAVKYYPEDKIKDDISQCIIPCWYRTYIYDKDFNKTTTRESICNEYAKLKDKDPKRAEALLKYPEEQVFQSVTPMMTGYYSHLMLRTAQSIYRHPELFDQVVPDYGLPVKRNSGITYKEKADFFFKHGLEAIEYFSNSDEFWSKEKGCYVNAIGNAQKRMIAQRKGEEHNDDLSYKAWNRSFSMMRAQAAAVVLMESIAPEKYVDRIARYRHQINSNFDVWFNNQRQAPTSRGIARSWGYAYTDTSRPNFMGEDIGHGTATLHLAMEINDYIKPKALTSKRLEEIGNNIVEFIYLPDEPEQRISEHIYHNCPIPAGAGSMSYRAMCASPYQRDVFPVLCDAARANSWKNISYGYWKFLYDGDPRKRVDTLVQVNVAPHKADIKSDLLVSYSFDTETIGGKSTKVTDLSPFKHHGTVHQQHNVGPSSGSGYHGTKGLDLGINGWIDLPDETMKILSKENALSVCFWGKNIERSSFEIFQARYNHSDGRAWNVLSFEPKAGDMIFIGGSPWFAPVNDHLMIPKKRIKQSDQRGWNHYCLVKDYPTKSLLIYLNGKIIQRRIECQWNINHSKELCIGSRSKSRRGSNNTISLDDFKIYKRALNQADIKALMLPK